MRFSSRAPAPSPVYTTSSRGDGWSRSTPSTNAFESTPRSAGVDSSYLSTSDSTSMPSGFSFSRQMRVNSDSSTGSNNSTASVSSSSTRKTSASGSVNVHTHCGRHSDQFLFGGWGPIVKGVFHKKN